MAIRLYAAPKNRTNAHFQSDMCYVLSVCVCVCHTREIVSKIRWFLLMCIVRNTAQCTLMAIIIITCIRSTLQYILPMMFYVVYFMCDINYVCHIVNLSSASCNRSSLYRKLMILLLLYIHSIYAYSVAV